jgi:histidine triad (HIT) family protein
VRQKGEEVMDECLFCKIVRKEIPAKIVHESKNVLAFDDINPQAPLHILVIPKVHLSSITKVEKKHAQLLAEMVEVINLVTQKKAVNGTGFRVIVNHGPDAGQAVAHLHFHVLGGRKLAWPPG